MKNLNCNYLILIGVYISCGVLAGDVLPENSYLAWDRLNITVEMTPDQSEIEVVYRVTNMSNKVVEIDRVTSSCGCTVSLQEEKILQPGATCAITVVFKKGGRRGVNLSTLKVYLKDQPHPVAELKLRTNIREALRIKPEILYWTGGKLGARQVSIERHYDCTEALETIEYNRDYWKVTLESKGSIHGSYILTIKPLVANKAIRDSIHLRVLDAEGTVVGSKRLILFIRP